MGLSKKSFHLYHDTHFHADLIDTKKYACFECSGIKNLGISGPFYLLAHPSKDKRILWYIAKPRPKQEETNQVFNDEELIEVDIYGNNQLLNNDQPNYSTSLKKFGRTYDAGYDFPSNLRDNFGDIAIIQAIRKHTISEYNLHRVNDIKTVTIEIVATKPAYSFE